VVVNCRGVKQRQVVKEEAAQNLRLELALMISGHRRIQAFSVVGNRECDGKRYEKFSLGGTWDIEK